MHNANTSNYAPINYYSLTNDLEQETALEDMHMFFVAFHHRQKKIINQLETGESSRKSLIINQDSHIKASAESVEDKKLPP